MLTVYSAKQLEQLAYRLHRELGREPLQNPLAPEVIVVQNHGIAQWFSLFMASKESIAANFKFEFPAERVWSLVRWMDPAVPQTLPSDREPMRWALMELLKEVDGSQFQLLHQYIDERDPQKQEMRRWKLAGRIADVFDQYLTYRPAMLLAWEQQKRTGLTPTERWQALLWQKLSSRWNQANQGRWTHRAALQQKLIDKLDESNIAPQTLPARINIFGVSAMPPVYLKILVKLSRHISVNFYNLKRGDACSASLLKSFDTSGEAYRSLLASFVKAEQAIDARFINIEKAASTKSSFFQTMKTDLLGPGEMVPQPSLDQTVQVHACHSPRREVEVLYDQLLGALDRDKTLTASDILVLMPDLETYAPQIEAVFGSPETEIPYIPWHFGERPANISPAVDSFLKIMDLMEGRFEVNAVADLLHTQPIRQRFDLDESHLSLLKKWMEDNRIRWGIDARFKRELGLPESNRFTWQSGLNSILLGYAMQPQDAHLFRGIYPYIEIEGGDSVALAGHFSNIMHRFFDCMRQCRQAHSLNDWSKLFQEWISIFLADNEANFSGIQQIREQLSRLKEHAVLAGYKDLVSFRVVHTYLKQALNQPQQGGSYGGRGVTFSSLRTMRNIPARMVCLLGMNDGAFPRSSLPVHFDLVSQYPRPGDRSHTTEDRQLFLDTLFAAKQGIYFSYVGQNNREDTVLSPSVVLHEWVDWIVEYFKIHEDKLIIKHPLKPFSSSYFYNQYPELFTYSPQNRRIAGQLREPTEEKTPFITSRLHEPEASHKKILLRELVRFFQHPAKYLLQNRFGIYLKEDELLDTSREDFVLGNLEKYHLNQALLDRTLNGQPVEAYKQVAIAQNKLPDGLPGRLSFQQQHAEAKRFGKALHAHLRSKKIDPIEVDLKIGEYRLTGYLNDLYEDGQLFYRFGRGRPRDYVDLWIQHVVFQLMSAPSIPRQSQFYSWENNNVQHLVLAPVRDARAVFKKLLDSYTAGLRGEALLFSESSYSYAEAVIQKHREEASALGKVASNWKNDFAKHRSDGYDRYNAFMLKDVNPLEKNKLTDSFKQQAISFWGPFFAAFSTVE